MFKSYLAVSDKLLAASAVIAIVALTGKSQHLPLLQSWIPAAVAMKDTTAFLILNHAWAGLIISRAARRRDCLPALFVAAPSILVAIGLSRDISRLENFGSFDPLQSWFPSIMTVLAASLLACKVLMVVTFLTPWPARVVSGLASLIGLCALAGYATGQPALYFFLPGYTTAMALNTALCFSILGLAYIPRRSV